MENEIDDNGAPKTDSRPSKQTNRKKQKKSSDKSRTEGKSGDKTNNDDTTEKPSSSPQFSKPKPSATTAADQNFFEENSAADDAKADEEESSTPKTRSHAAANDTFANRTNRTGPPWNSLSHNGLLLMISIILHILGQMGGVSGILTVTPVNVLAKSGTEVRLRCSTDLTDPVYWLRRLHGASETKTIYYGSLGFSNLVNGRFKMDHSRGQGSYDVIISNVTAEDAGVYVCQDDGGMGDRREMELVVVEYFNCAMPMPPVGFMGQNDIDDIAKDEIRATCSLKYHGNQKPRFHWRWSVDSVVQSTERVSGSTMINSTAVTRPREKLNGALLTCTATVSSDAAEDSAVQWTSSQVTVLHASLQKGSVEQCQGCPVTLVCDPECVYSEERVNSDICRCVATYEAKGSRREFTFSAYACDGSVSESNGFVVIVVAVAVAIGVVAAAAAAIVTLKVMKREKKKPAPTNKTAEDFCSEINSNGSDESSVPMIASKQ